MQDVAEQSAFLGGNRNIKETEVGISNNCIQMDVEVSSHLSVQTIVPTFTEKPVLLSILVCTHLF